MINIAKGVGTGNGGEYFERLAPYLVFVFFAVISIVFWVFNWICWNRKCCCFHDIFGEYADKVFVWWLSWIFLCGILACCIAGFVTANRYGFALYGVQCAYERIYYDSIYGQQKQTLPKFEGLEYINDKIDSLISITNFTLISMNLFYNDFQELYKDFENETKGNEEFVNNIITYPIPKSIAEYLFKNYNVSIEEKQKNFTEDLNKILKEAYSGINNYIQLYNNGKFLKNATETLQYLKSNFTNNISKFKDYESKFIKDFNYYANVAYHWGQTVPIIFLSLLLMFVVISGALLITYYCNCCFNFDQKFWIIPMHIAWNGIRFFMFSFFIYGCAYGMLYLYALDLIGYFNYAFSEENLMSNNVVILPKGSQQFLQHCLSSESYNSSKKISELNIVNDFINNAIKLRNWDNIDCSGSKKEMRDACNELLQNLKNNYTNYIKKYKDDINKFEDLVEQTGNIYANFNCSFIHNNIKLMYNAMWDFAWETRVLCALSCCIGFFGIFAVYGFLWSMHLWELQEHRPLINNRNKVPNEKDDSSDSGKNSDDS